METGIYEQIINKLFKHKIEQAEEEGCHFFIGTKEIDKQNASRYLSNYFYKIIQAAIAYLPESISVQEEIELFNDLIKHIRDKFSLNELNSNLIDDSGKILTAIVDKTKCDYPNLANYIQEITPETQLTQSVLFTGSNQRLSLVSELQREIRSADEIYILVSFIRKSGLNLLLKELKNFTRSGKKLKVITTTYMKATEYSAIRNLALLENCEVKISYNGDVDRLHAKAYLFLRNSGFHTSYIGSSNISRAALTKGLEWNIKATTPELPHIIQSIKDTFNSYWEEDTFQPFLLGVDDERLQMALGNQKSSFRIDYNSFDLIKAKQYQKEILEKLTLERELHGHWKNLIVAATGTGKTVISAFDYKRFKESHPRANLLFVAHREEILRQAMDLYRRVLKDENFGELWLGGKNPTTYTHLFASKDTLYSRLNKGFRLDSDYYDFVIIDEAHHVLADSYQPIIELFKPKILLGMTATPERRDGDIRSYFCDEISAEIRLADALNNQLLAPFHYYGITDSVDLSTVHWSKGHYVESELTKVYTANDRRTGVILHSLERYLNNVTEVRALCFCVSIEHAKYMAAKFTLAGLKSAVLTSENSESRSRYINELTQKKLNYLFVVDIFNEGVDIPCIDTILFLRPTESLTIYLQQFGRGLRKAKGKEFVTIFDFVGNARAEFNYTDRFRAMIGRSSMSVKEELEHSFPHLPLNCSIHLEEKAKTYILANINSLIKSFSSANIKRTISRFEQDYDLELTLDNFIAKTQIPLTKIYTKGRTWGSLCAEVHNNIYINPLQQPLSKAVANKWLSTDSYSYFHFLSQLAEQNFNINERDLSLQEQLMCTMLYYDLYDTAAQYDSLQELFDTLAANSIFIKEIKEVIARLKKQTIAYEQAIPASFNAAFPLCVHGRYTKSQIQAAIETSTLQKKSSSREGVERNKKLDIEAMYVDLIKDREANSTTNYNDIAMSNTLFNWETQSRVSQNTPTGQNYIHQRQTMLLFVREQNKDPEERTRTMGFIYLGEVTLVSYQGDAPMTIQWRLQTPMPASLWRFAGKLAAAI